jgi:signal transduction histidine kinase
MRWPIQVQLLVPMLAVVVLAIVLASATTAYWGSVRARNEQEESLRRVASTLTEASFPLTERVLRQMSGFSGAEFVLLDEAHQIVESTFPLDQNRADLERFVGEAPRDDSAKRQNSLVVVGRTYLATWLPIAGSPPRVAAGTLLLLYPEDRWTARVYEASYPALLTGLVAAIAAVIITAALARHFVRPIQAIVERTAAIAHGDFHPIDVAPRNDEIRDLALSINRMAEQLAQYGAETRRSERMRTLGQLGAGIAHQLRNAATGGRMAIELHKADCPLGASNESLDVALRQLRLMESYLQRFLALGQPESAAREDLALNDLVAEVLPLVRPMCSHSGIALDFVPSPESLRIRGNPESLRQLVINLTLNAVEAANQTGAADRRVKVQVERVAGDRGTLSVCDSGPGPSTAAGEQLFEPFFTTKPDGTGLGLFVARQTAQSHSALIHWDRRDGMTRFLVEFPLISGG